MLAATEARLLERYLMSLRRLSTEAQQEFVTRLTESLRKGTSPSNKPEPTPKTMLDFAGIWQNDPEADSIETAIREGRSARAW